MRAKVRQNDKKFLYGTLLVLVGIVTLLPVGYNCIMDSGIVGEWIARVEELASGLGEGRLYLFLSEEALAGIGRKANGVNSNLWFFLPGLLYRLLRNMVHVYDACMLVLQVGTLVSSILLFQRIFADRETKLPAFFGVLLYMTSPYRIYVSYDLADISQAVAWMLLPFYLWAIVGVMRTKRRWLAVLAACASLAGIGYADAVFFLIAALAAILTGVLWRRFLCFVPVLAGGCLFLPRLNRLARYFAVDFQEWNVSLQPMLQDGYRLGEFFSSYFFRSGHPGMGLGMFLCLLTGIWLRFVENKRESHRGCRIAAALSVCLAALSLYGFLWELLRRIGGWPLKLLALTGGPALFWGMACLCLCVPAACSMERISRHENKWVAFAVPMAVTIACMGICVYQCNMLAYGRTSI